jgi:Arm DNA-binding domain
VLKVLNPIDAEEASPSPKLKRFTDANIAKLPPAPERKRYAVSDFGDRMVAGLRVRVTDKGAKSFILWRRYGDAKNPAARRLGAVGAMTVEQAREKAAKWIKLIEAGEDPRAVERRDRDATRDQNAITFKTVFEEYLVKHVKGQRRAKDAEREMRKDLLARWKDKPLSEPNRLSRRPRRP